MGESIRQIWVRLASVFSGRELQLIMFCFVILTEKKRCILPSMLMTVASGDKSCNTLAGRQGSSPPFTNTTLEIGRLRPEEKFKKYY